MNKREKKKCKLYTYNIETKVKIAILKIDQKNGQKFLSCIVLDVNEETGMLILGCAAGTLDISYDCKEVQPLDAEDWPELDRIPLHTVSLRTAANYKTPSPNWKDLSSLGPCHCKSKCMTIRCPCYAAFYQCIAECHNGKQCGNHVSTKM